MRRNLHAALCALPFDWDSFACEIDWDSFACKIDWEAPLVEVLGDVVGHQLAEVLRRFFRWSEGAQASLKRQVSEYLLEEGRLTPPKPELEHFYDAVQSGAMRVERAQNQVEKLLAKAASGRTSQ